MLQPAFSLITLGVRDVARATAFYAALGWKRSEATSNDSISFIPLNNIVLALFGADDLEKDCGVEPPSATGFRGMTLALNLADEGAVDEACRLAEAAGARVTKSPQKTFWGGYHAIIQDLDGHTIEFAHNPFFPLNPDGTINMPR